MSLLWLLNNCVEICVVERAKMDELVSEAIMCDNYRKTEELKVGVFVAITSIAKSIDTLGIKTTLSTTWIQKCSNDLLLSNGHYSIYRQQLKIIYNKY